MKRIESCPSIVDSVSFFDNDANIADSFHADLAPLPTEPINSLDSGARWKHTVRLPRSRSRCADLPVPRAVPEYAAVDVDSIKREAPAGGDPPRKDAKALTAEERKQRRCGQPRELLCRPSPASPPARCVPLSPMLLPLFAGSRATGWRQSAPTTDG